MGGILPSFTTETHLNNKPLKVPNLLLVFLFQLSRKKTNQGNDVTTKGRNYWILHCWPVEFFYSGKLQSGCTVSNI